MSDKIYCGSGKRQESENGIWLKCTINPDKIKDYIQEYEGSRFVKLNINVYDSPNQFGKDVTITIDTYKPNREEPKEPRLNSPYIAPEDSNSDLPF